MRIFEAKRSNLRFSYEINKLKHEDILEVKVTIEDKKLLDWLTKLDTYFKNQPKLVVDADFDRYEIYGDDVKDGIFVLNISSNINKAGSNIRIMKDGYRIHNSDIYVIENDDSLEVIGRRKLPGEFIGLRIDMSSEHNSLIKQILGS